MSPKDSIVAKGDQGERNRIINNGDMIIKGNISGNDNTIKIDGAMTGDYSESGLIITINGNNNLVRIGAGAVLNELSIVIGSESSPANHSTVYIGSDFSCESNCVFFLYNPGNKLIIGNDCMFSNNIIIRCGELPHLLFDANTAQFLDGPNEIRIGDHVWIGEISYLNKHAGIPDGCIVGSCSVVTKAFKLPDCVIAGNPARVVREHVKWFRNHDHIPPSSPYAASWQSYAASAFAAASSQDLARDE